MDPSRALEGVRPSARNEKKNLRYRPSSLGVCLWLSFQKDYPLLFEGNASLTFLSLVVLLLQHTRVAMREGVGGGGVVEKKKNRKNNRQP